MSVDYRVRFYRNETDGTVKDLRVYFSVGFGEILDNLPVWGERTETICDEDGDEYSTTITTYHYDDLQKYVTGLKEKRKEYESRLRENEQNLYRALTNEIFDRIEHEIDNCRSMVEIYDEELSYAQYVMNGVSFHFFYLEGFYDMEGVMFEVEVC